MIWQRLPVFANEKPLFASDRNVLHRRVNAVGKKAYERGPSIRQRLAVHTAKQRPGGTSFGCHGDDQSGAKNMAHTLAGD